MFGLDPDIPFVISIKECTLNLYSSESREIPCQVHCCPRKDISMSIIPQLTPF